MAKQTTKTAATPQAAQPRTPSKTDLVRAGAPASLPVTNDPFAAQAGAGLENVRPTDRIIPRITILQGLSPQLNKNKPEFIAGASMGDICDVGTGEIFESPLLFLPVHYSRKWVEWTPQGGRGLVKIHDTEEILEECVFRASENSEFERPYTKDGNSIVETAQFFGLNMSAGGRHSFLPMKSTQLKKARRWLTLANAERVKRVDGTFYTPPLFYRVYSLGVVDESKPGQSFSGWKIERSVTLQEFSPDWRPMFDDAVAFRDSLSRGEVRGDIASAVDEDPPEEGSAEQAM